MDVNLVKAMNLQRVGLPFNRTKLPFSSYITVLGWILKAEAYFGGIAREPSRSLLWTSVAAGRARPASQLLRPSVPPSGV